MKPVRLGKEELKARFNISERFAIRIAALSKIGLGLTEAAIEEAARRAPVLELLLSDAILHAAGSMGPSEFAALFPERFGLTVAPGSDGRVLALEEEILAEEPAELARVETQGGFEFSPAQIEELRLRAATSVDPASRIEAIRRLSLSHLPTSQKGGIFLGALQDADANVRREAVSALVQVGLDPQVGDALRALGEGTPAQRRLVLQRLASLIPPLQAPEGAVVFVALLSQIREEQDGDVLRSLVDLIGAAPDVVRSAPERLIGMVRTLLKILADRFSDLSQPVLRLFERLSRGGSEEDASAIWREVEPLADRRLKALFLSIVSRFPLPAGLRRKLAAEIARTLGGSHGDEIEARQFLDVGRTLGDEQVDAYLEFLPEVRDECLGSYLAAVDTTASSTTVSDAAVERVGRAWLRLLETRGKGVRRFLLECSLCHSPRLPAEIKEKLALDFLSNLHLDGSGRAAELTNLTLSRMGRSAVPALKEILERTSHDVERAAALDLIGAAAGSAGSEAGEIVEFLRDFERRSGALRGRAWVALSRACANPKLDPARPAEIFRELKDLIKNKSKDFELIVALGNLASSPAIPEVDACALALDMASALESDLPEPKLTAQRTDEGTRLVIGDEALAYTEFIPNVLTALDQIYRSGKLARGTRRQIVDRLIARWDDLIQFRTIWAPGTVIEMARTFCSMARHDATPPEDRCLLLGAVLRYCRNTTVCRTMAEGLAFHDEGSDDYARVVSGFIGLLLDLERHPDYQQADDRRAVLASMGRAARNRRLAVEAAESDRRRERIVELLIEQSGPQEREVGRVLRDLSQSPHLGDRLRARLQGVLGG
jgi:HEAT repeat protein